MTASPDATDLQRVLDLERELQDPTTRADRGRLEELLGATFVEIGASGRRWERDEILAMLADEADSTGSPIEVHDLTGRHLSDDIVQVWWESQVGDRRARRTSLWHRTSRDWECVYHQGTPL